MSKKVIMREFIKKIEENKLVTLFIMNLFDYENLNDYNYLFRMKEEDNNIIIDIYDNISDNRFNRYVFCFENGEYDIKVIEEGNVFVTYIIIKNIISNDDKLVRFAYLFKINNDRMIEYANSFLDRKIVSILDEILKKPIHI